MAETNYTGESGENNLPEPLKTKYLTHYVPGEGDEMKKLNKPVFEYPNGIYLGISPEAAQLGIKHPHFFLEIPDQYTQQVADVIAGVRDDLNDSPVMSKPHPKKTDLSADEETIITMLIFEPKVSEAIKNESELDAFLLKHRENMTELDDNKHSKDYLRIPTLEDVKQTLIDNHRGKDPQKNHEEALKIVKSGAMLTVEPTDYEKAEVVQHKMIKAIEWLEKCALEKIDIFELLEHLKRCFQRGKYPNVDEPPKITGRPSARSIQN